MSYFAVSSFGRQPANTWQTVASFIISECQNLSCNSCILSDASPLLENSASDNILLVRYFHVS